MEQLTLKDIYHKDVGVTISGFPSSFSITVEKAILKLLKPKPHAR